MHIAENEENKKADMRFNNPQNTKVNHIQESQRGQNEEEGLLKAKE